jgi:Leucine Rich repeat
MDPFGSKTQQLIAPDPKTRPRFGEVIMILKIYVAPFIVTLLSGESICSISHQLDGISARLFCSSSSSMRPNRFSLFWTRKKQNWLVRRLGHNDPSLTELDLTDASLPKETILRLASNLQRNTSLRGLWLENVNLADSTVMLALAEALKENAALKSLSLARTDIDDRGIVALAEALKHNQSLWMLSLRGNHISDRGISALTEMLKQNRSLAVFPSAVSDQGIGELVAPLSSNSIVNKIYVERNVGVPDKPLSWVDWLTLLVLLPGLLAVHLHMAYDDRSPTSGPEFSLLQELGERAIMTWVICYMLASYLHGCMVHEQQADKNSAKSTRGLLVLLLMVFFRELLADIVQLLLFFNFVNGALITFMLGILQMSVEVVMHRRSYARDRVEAEQ